jgi:L-asparaginase
MDGAGAQGVVVVCAGTVHAAQDVAKVHTLRLDAFSSGDAGPLAYVEGGALRILRNWPAARAKPDDDAIKRVANASAWPRVEIVLNHAGADGLLVQALLGQGVQGIVVAATGTGTLHHHLEAALLQAQARGVKVLRSTRCAQGRALQLAGDSLPAHPGSPVKARIDLLLELLG